MNTTILRELQKLFLVALLAISTTAFACINVNSPTIISISNSTDCYSWASGDLTINSHVSISSSDSSYDPIFTSGVVGTLTNNGSIYNININGAETVRTQNNITSIINNGLIQNDTGGFTIFVYQGTLTTLTNSGTITNTGAGGNASGIGVIGAGWGGSGVITNLHNLSSGIISSNGQSGVTIAVGGQIEYITNAGIIAGIGTSAGGDDFSVNDKGSGIYNDNHIHSITNTGSIYTNTPSAFGIMNNVYNSANSHSDSSNGQIDTINNLQGLGNPHGPLTYTGALPTNYNIIINSASQYGRLAGSSVTGATAFGIYAGSLIASRIYTGVLQGLSDSNVGATRTGTYDGMNWTLAISSGTSWDLTFTGASLVGTQTSVHNSAQRLRSVFNQSIVSSNFANMNTYDCNLFDSKGMCISAGGRYTTVDNPNSNSTSAVVVVGYKATPNIRIGGFLDQNVSNNTPTGIKISNKNPLMGVFAVWNQNADGLGYQVKVANAYQDKDVNTTRDVIGSSEAGMGATNLNTQSYVGELSYAFLTNQDKTTLRPYIALRQTTIKQDAYTETGVATPLTFASLKDRSTSALVGLKLNHALTPKATLTASLGIEQDLEHSVDQYSATSAGISGLTSENFNDSIKRTRPVASAGAYYAVSKTQRISGDVYYQQLPFQSTGSTTAYFSYMIGI